MTRWPIILRLISYAAMAFLYLPLLAVGVYSVNASGHGVVWGGFTLNWYRKLLSNEQVLSAAWNTLVLAMVSTVISTLLGTLLAVAMERYPWPRWLRGVMDTLVELPIVTPDIIFAAALVVAFSVLQLMSTFFDPGMPAMIIGHVSFQIAFVTLVVRSRLGLMGRTLDEAARDLYADGWTVLTRVTLPLALPGVIAGAMLAFTLSLDDFVITFFTYGPDDTTLPIYIYGSLRRGISPEVHAISTLIMLATVLMVLAVERLSRRKDAAE
jgi:spermidine/putrescine transport system permease protein